LAAAQQHIQGIHALLTGYQLFVPLAPLTRAVIENAARIQWLLDLDLYEPTHIRRRAGRVFLAQLDDLTRAKAAACSTGHTDAPKLGAEVRNLRTVVLKERFFPDEIEDRKGRLIICGEALPGFSDSMTRYEKAGNGAFRASAIRPALERQPSDSTLDLVHAPRST
jgi:hypothetical protein